MAALRRSTHVRRGAGACPPGLPRICPPGHGRARYLPVSALPGQRLRPARGVPGALRGAAVSLLAEFIAAADAGLTPARLAAAAAEGQLALSGTAR